MLVITISLLIVLICYVLHIMRLNYIENNICGTWKQSEGDPHLPGFLSIDTNVNFSASPKNVYSKGCIYYNGKPCAIPLLCTEENLIIYYYNKGYGSYSRMSKEIE